MSDSESRAYELTASTVTFPIFRGGTDTIRLKLSASRGLETNLR